MSEPGPLESVLMPIHDCLDALFLAHQVALLDRDLPRARRMFDRFRDAILAHAADEEAHVLPLYAESGGDDSNSPSSQFRLEHDKIRRFVSELDERLTALASDTGQLDDRSLLTLLDRESWFKNLFAHHDLRERNALYPRLSSGCPQDRQRTALARLTLTEVPPVD